MAEPTDTQTQIPIVPEVAKHAIQSSLPANQINSRRMTISTMMIRTMAARMWLLLMIRSELTKCCRADGSATTSLASSIVNYQ
jgi:hypothetical protein